MGTEQEPQEHHLSVTRTARYYTLGADPGRTKSVWFLCHGYGQLGAEFIQYFQSLDDGATLLVAPEALMRFYLDSDAAGKGRHSRVGASWMTREDRLNDIGDYVRYLDTVYEEIFQTLNRTEVQFNVLGFSQGVATAARWVAASAFTPDNIVAWGGTLPPDLDMEAARAKFNAASLYLVVGATDDYVPEEALPQEQKRLISCDIAYRLIRFDGGHHISRKVLAQLKEEFHQGV